MAFDLGAVLTSILLVLGVGLLLGAGIPTVYALGVRAFESPRKGSTVVGVLLMTACAVLAVGGIVLIIFGDSILG